MAKPLFDPILKPVVQGSTFGFRLGRKAVVFGDGYEQRAEKNLNNVKRKARLVWAAIDSVDVDSGYIDFFLANAITGFQWQHPRESSPRNWKVVGDIDDSYADGKLVRLEVEIEEVFDIE